MPIPLFQDGFRPFFLGAAAVASAQVLAWLAFLGGSGGLPAGWSPVIWHGHEMIFGFAAALIAGFLLTAVPNWTGTRVAGPGLIAAMFLLWAVPRVGPYWPAMPLPLMQALSAAFLPVLALVIAVPIIRGRNARNYKVILVLTALAAAGILLHLRPSLAALRAAADLLLMLMLIIGARIIPFFTGRRLPHVAVTNDPTLAFMVPVTALVAVILGWRFQPALPLALLNLAAGALVLVQLAQWKPWATLREPMLWILHLGYAWLGVALLLCGLGAPISVGIHAVTVGALGCLAIGMMARVALGHGGREIRADIYMVTAFVMVAAAALPRLAYALLPFNEGRVALTVSGLLWSFGFLLYLVRFIPVMFSARNDR